MKILLIHQAFVTPADSGGTRHFEFAVRCLNSGHKFTVITSDLNYLSGKRIYEKKRLITDERQQGIQIVRTYTIPTLHRSFVWRVFAFLNFMILSMVAGLRSRHVDLVMGTSPPIFQAFSAWFVALLKRRSFLLEIRDLWPEFAIDMGVLNNPILIYLSRLLENFLYRRSNHILVNSPAYRDYLLSKDVPSDKISLIPNGVDTEQFNPAKRGDRIRMEFGLADKFVATYTGALGLANDISTILRAAQHLQNKQQIHFLIVGDGKERSNLENQAKLFQLHNVTFTGPRPKAEMNEFLASSDVCLATLLPIPMFQTTYPNKVFDYMAAGRPTILAIDGVIRQVLEAAGGGIFVPPGDDRELARAIAILKNDRDLAHEMGAKARDYVVKEFNRSNQANSFVSLINKFASSY